MRQFLSYLLLATGISVFVKFGIRPVVPMGTGVLVGTIGTAGIAMMVAGFRASERDLRGLALVLAGIFPLLFAAMMIWMMVAWRG